MPIAYFKDRFLPEEECFVPISDRSFRFGDGVFETLLVYNGKLYDFATHYERLCSGLVNYRIDIATDNLKILCEQVIAVNNIKQGFVRIVVSRGSNGAGAMGYLPKGVTPYLLIQAAEKPYPEFRELSLLVSSHPASVHTPSKTNNSLIYTLAMMEAEEKHCDNALMLDNIGRICETASGNIFWITDGTLYTPSTDLPMVPGTMRRRALELWEGAKKEGHFTCEALAAADEIFMTNVAYIVAGITKIVPLGIERKTGEFTRNLRKRMDDDIVTQTGAA